MLCSLMPTPHTTLPSITFVSLATLGLLLLSADHLVEGQTGALSATYTPATPPSQEHWYADSNTDEPSTDAGGADESGASTTAKQQSKTQQQSSIGTLGSATVKEPTRQALLDVSMIPDTVGEQDIQPNGDSYDRAAIADRSAAEGSTMSFEDWPEATADGSIRLLPPLPSATSSGMQPKLGGLVLPDVPQDAGSVGGYAGVIAKPGAGDRKASKVKKVPAGLGRKSRPGRGQTDPEQASLRPEEHDVSEDENSILSTWWPMGSHWQPPVKPFVVKRDVNRPGMRSPKKSALSDLASLLPGMKPKPGIPKIFHQVYLAGEQALADAEAAAARSLERWPPVKREWRDSCLRHHPGWEFKLWNLTAMEQLLRERYPWFLPTFLAYPQPIHRVDAVRPFIMHAYGGVYIDVDVECLQPVDGFLEDHELVFQEEDFGYKSLVNSAIAGVPGHNFWLIWQQIIYQRAYQLKKQNPYFWVRDYDVHAVLNATGPWALRAAFEKFSRDYGLLHYSYIGGWRINETDVMVYPVGTWFVPCVWDNIKCHDIIEHMAAVDDIPVWLAGHHKNAGSWFKAAGYTRATQRWRLKALALFALLGGLAVWRWLVQCWRRRDAAYQEHSRLQSLRPPDGWQRRGSVATRPKRRD